MGAEHTSVPRWPTADPGVDETGRSYTILAFDETPIADRWAERLAELGRPVRIHRAVRWDERALAESLRDATVGWRLMIAGPEVDVLRVYARALDGGALDAEVRILVTDDRRRRVRCAHCTATTEADVRPGEHLPCGGCGRVLVVHAHVSRTWAAYLGSVG